MQKSKFLLCGIGVGLLLLAAAAWSAGRTADRPTAGADVATEQGEDKEDYIKWVEFHVTREAMERAFSYDVDTYGQENHIDWIDLLAYLGAKYGGDFSRYSGKDMEAVVAKLEENGGSMEDITKDMEYYKYYREAYGAVLDGLVGGYEIEENQSEGQGTKTWVKKYGLKAFAPIAKNFPYCDYDDFGVSRSYGYRRNHLGHDMMGQVGTPVICVESGTVRVMGWNQYGGWRVGIDSFDKKRYYYYAHLRQNAPFAQAVKEGDKVQAGDVIGYMGRTGYSTTENVNNIDTYHLHFGLQLIFDESQRDGNNEIWVNPYELVKFLYKNRSEVVRDDATKEWSRVYQMRET